MAYLNSTVLQPTSTAASTIDLFQTDYISTPDMKASHYGISMTTLSLVYTP